MVPFKYPFYNVSDARCGLIKVDCTSEGGEIQFGEHSYATFGKFDSQSSVVIVNKTFEKLVKNESCEALMNNFISPSPLLFSFSVDPFITVFKCANNRSYAEQMDAYFGQHNYYNHSRCNDYTFYYKYSVSNATVPSNLPHTCQVIQLPLLVRQPRDHEELDETKIFTLLSSFVYISLQLSPSCTGCIKKGGQCHTNTGLFQCLNAKNGKPGRNLILILGDKPLQSY
ncbi:serine-threonine/tyrosine-protein kinase catalytic domain-containing protein [Artemisia annua]|uniref:Serine-threonine/tyrosine-protein kinase catalytic domain-containing protein n=1 Tax=Artemisia annua TaxID=35608 RepID=A0A2U1NCG0_ARTAN|nr:serine-threonine/tyrosine-protein kinase catalytic domain-containing protein [Artemisia annua]